MEKWREDGAEMQGKEGVREDRGWRFDVVEMRVEGEQRAGER